jgi:hypothetical protein
LNGESFGFSLSFSVEVAVWKVIFFGGLKEKFENLFGFGIMEILYPFFLFARYSWLYKLSHSSTFLNDCLNRSN